MKNSLFLILAALFTACGSAESPCKSPKACVEDSNCECWCSVKCGFRKKNDSDHPVYIENDPNGKNCYCKQWDVDHYKENCIEGKKMKEPEGTL